MSFDSFLRKPPALAVGMFTIVLLVLLLAESLLFGMCIAELKAAYKDPDKAWVKYRPIMYRETPAYHNIQSL